LGAGLTLLSPAIRGVLLDTIGIVGVFFVDVITAALAYFGYEPHPCRTVACCWFRKIDMEKYRRWCFVYLGSQLTSQAYHLRSVLFPARYTGICIDTFDDALLGNISLPYGD